MRGKKGVPHPVPADPPRRRANKTRGHGTWDTDRPPVFSTIGRESGHVRLAVGRSPNGPALTDFVARTTRKRSTVNTDEWRAYARVPDLGRRHVTVCHTPG